MHPPSRNTTIELRGIKFSYSAHAPPVFEGLDFSFSGERIGLIGDNGSGKTTLLHLMVGLITPQSGDILLNGNLLKSEQDFQVLRRQVGFLFQNVDDQLFSPSVLEDVAFGPLNLGCSSEEARTVALDALAKVGMISYQERITHHLSGGEKRLVALATVLAMRPGILLLDEPTNDLDQAARNRLLDILGELNQPLILISHDWDFLAKLTDCYFALEHGKLHRSDKVSVHQHRHAHPLGEHDHQHRHD